MKSHLLSLNIEALVDERVRLTTDDLAQQLQDAVLEMKRMIAEGEDAIRFALGEWRKTQSIPPLPALPILCDDRHILSCVYGLVSRDEPTRVRYIGQSVVPVARYADHCSAKAAPRVAEWVKSLGERAPLMVLLGRVPRGWSYPLVNFTGFSDIRAVGLADLNTSLPVERTCEIWQ